MQFFLSLKEHANYYIKNILHKKILLLFTSLVWKNIIKQVRNYATSCNNAENEEKKIRNSLTKLSLLFHDAY